MVQTKTKNLEIIKKFKKRLKKIGVEKIIFFGSRAKGNFSQESDFDIIVISNKFEGIKWYKRSLKVYLNWDEHYPLEVLCYTPREFERLRKKIGIVQEAVKEGIVI